MKSLSLGMAHYLARVCSSLFYRLWKLMLGFGLVLGLSSLSSATSPRVSSVEESCACLSLGLVLLLWRLLAMAHLL